MVMDSQKAAKLEFKEEKDLLFEVSLLSELIEETKHILKIETAIKDGSKALSEKDHKKIQEHASLVVKIFQDEKRNLNRISRVERRRVTDERKLFKEINKLSSHLDNSKKQKVRNISEQVRVHSATLIREFSRYTGELAKAIKEKDTKKVGSLEGQAHAAAMGLLALLKEVKNVIKDHQTKVKQDTNFNSSHQLILGVEGYFRECAVKTAYIKSIPMFKYFLEKGRAEQFHKKAYFFDNHHCLGYNFSWNTFTNTKNIASEWIDMLKNNQDHLRKVLSEKDFDQLCNIYFKVPKGTILIFNSSSKFPALCMNPDKIPSFATPGFVSHYFPGGNTKKLFKDGVIASPLDTLIRKKKYFSDKQSSADFSRRVTDGISFGYQEHQRSSAYIKDENRKVGGLLLFPIMSTIDKGHMLDFAGTMDQFPELCLRDARHGSTEIIDIIKNLLWIRKNYLGWIAKFKPYKKAFEYAVSHHEELMNIFGTNEIKISTDKADGIHFYDNYKETNAFYIGSDPFSKAIYLASKKNNLNIKQLLKLAKEKNFFQFSLVINYTSDNITYFDNQLIPKRYRGQAKLRQELEGTSFVKGLDMYYATNKPYRNYYLILQHIHKNPLIWQGIGHRRSPIQPEGYLELCKKMNPKHVRDLFVEALSSIKKDLNVLLKRTTDPKNSVASINLSKGILLLNGGFTQTELFSIIQRKRIPTIAYLANDHNMHFTKKQLDEVTSKMLKVNMIAGINQTAYSDQCYFTKHNGHLVYVNRRKQEHRTLF
ncbi:hypothetical protein HOA92_04145 [archaeon]|nr:hypothetical protein [archaeon]